jgi:hypothetical protein
MSNNYSEVTVTIEKKLKVPNNWGMFTELGNQLVGQRMCGLVQECNGEVTNDAYEKAAHELYSDPRTSESMDTVVREAIWAFLDDNNVNKLDER